MSDKCPVCASPVDVHGNVTHYYVSENAALKADLEDERIRLAACGVAAMQNTESSRKDRITKDNPYWSASYGDICNGVDREIKLRAELADYKIGAEVEARAGDEARAEVERLLKILHREFNENDELGAEYLGITMVREENQKLKDVIGELISELNKVLPRAPSMDGKASWSQCQLMVDRIIQQAKASLGNDTNEGG